jgi:hypothetical protein
MTDAVYLMSFTAGGLLYAESLKLARLYESAQDWDTLRTLVLAGNLLQMRTETATRRIFREIAPRLQQLTPEALDLLRTGARHEQHHMLWLAVCKRYRFIYDFAAEVIREKFLRLDLALTYDDYDIFFNHKAEWHPEVEGVAESTRKKQRQVVFKMLREAELLSPDDQILPALLTPRVQAVIAADDPAHFAVFPVSPLELQEGSA